jgi:hypothetical protein
LRPYEIGIGAYSKVNIKYFKPLTYDSITKIALEFLVQACAFKHQKSRLSPVYPNDPSLVI